MRCPLSPIMPVPLALALLSMATPAQAACQRIELRFFPLQNDSVSSDEIVTRGSPCWHRYWAGGVYRLDSVSVAQRPKNGTIGQNGMAVRYQPHKGFKGSDQYVVKVCGSSHAGTGCSTLTYRVTVK